MAKKGKTKISKVKKNNQTTNKMKKQGKLRLQRHREKIQKQKQPALKPQVEYSSESDSDAGEEWRDMLDEDEQKYIMSRLAKQPQLLSNVPEQEDENKNQSRKRKKSPKERLPKRPNMGSDSGADSDSNGDDSGSELEEKYEKDQADKPAKKLRPLLPIKTKEGILERAEEVVDTESEQEDETPAPKQTINETQDSDSGVEGTGEEEEPQENAIDDEVVSAVQLLAARRDKLQHDKMRIGALCSSLLESPEKKLKNFYPILYLMEERLKDGTLNLHSVRKLATLSAFEVFKDILPEYQIRHQDYSNVKLKKDTLSLYKYEKELLEFYKRYLQRLEKAANVLRRKKGDTRKPDEAAVGLALVSLQCMCGLLVARPAFNYATNMAQSVLPFLDCGERARGLVAATCAELFAEDQKGEITLTVVRLINQLAKRRGQRLHPAALDCLLELRIRDVDLDASADIQHKKKQEEKHKKRIINLSKKEKKRSKKLKEVERELMETEAQESEAARRKTLAEVVKTVFHIYFRLLKTAPHSKLLSAALDGLAKFTHVINLEYYSDLVGILERLLADESVARRSRLQAVRTVLAVLAGAGDALNVDPAGLHAHLYQQMITVTAGATSADAPLVLEAAWQVCGRARRVSAAVLAALAKRLATLAAQLAPHAALGCLLLLHQMAQQSKAVASLTEPDTEGGSGRYDPLLASPEHCNARSSALYELCVLTRSFHPAVRALAAAVLQGGALPKEFNKMTPMQVLSQYDGSQMSFKPAVPAPRAAPAAKRLPAHSWAQHDFRDMCQAVEEGIDLSITTR